MTNRIRAIKSLAKYMAYSNASSFISTHSENGEYFINEIFDKEYVKSCKIVANKLTNLSGKFLKQYNELGIEINTEYSGDLDNRNF